MRCFCTPTHVVGRSLADGISDTHQDFELGESAFNLPIPDQVGCLAIHIQPHAESASRLLRVQWKNGDSLEGWCWEGEKELSGNPRCPVKPGLRHIRSAIAEEGEKDPTSDTVKPKVLGHLAFAA